MTERTAENDAPDDVWLMYLCETEKVMLRPDVLYRFEVKDDCARCVELAAPYRATRAIPPGVCCPRPPGAPGGDGICECEHHDENGVIPPGSGDTP